MLLLFMRFELYISFVTPLKLKPVLDDDSLLTIRSESIWHNFRFEIIVKYHTKQFFKKIGFLSLFDLI